MTTAPPRPRAWRDALRRFGRPRSVVAAPLLALLVLLVLVAVGETLGWPFLAGPLQAAASRALSRQVQLGGGPADAGPSGAALPRLRLRLLGNVTLRTSQLQIAAAPWSKAPHLLRARDVLLELRYGELWRAWRTRPAGGEQPLRIERLQAADLDVRLERRADGSASWQVGTPAAGGTPWPLPQVGRLQLGAGTLHLRDALQALDVQVTLAVAEPPAGAAAGAGGAAPPRTAQTLEARASGALRGMPLRAALSASSPHAGATPLRAEARIGRALFAFDGSASDVWALSGLDGQFSLSGPSLAAVGYPLGVTLPTTAAFSSAGRLRREGGVWQMQLARASIGGSRLEGDFRYDTGARVPRLTGRLGGERLLLVDLGPVVGTTPVVDTRQPGSTQPVHAPGRVLPDRPFDLASLRAMDADVQVAIASVDLNRSGLEPLRPLRAHLVLAGGVLTLDALDARTAQGTLGGTLSLDGRGEQALWRADLRWRGVRLERWLGTAGRDGRPAAVTGRLDGSAQLAGRGRSTAEILGSLEGRARTELLGGSISHLAVEAAGLDLAQALGLMLVGDDALPVQCAVADLVAEAGVFRPRVMVLDTSDSAIWVEGSLSLAAETLDLRAVVSPKDFSPLSLRTPLRVRGSFADPDVSLQTGPMGLKLGAAFLLALVNPLAALIPLVDTGSAGEAERNLAGCQALRRRIAAPAR